MVALVAPKEGALNPVEDGVVEGRMELLAPNPNEGVAVAGAGAPNVGF